MRQRKTLSAKSLPVLIASISARSLVEAARRSGFLPFAVDFYADMDLRASAGGWRKMPGSVNDGFQADALLVALEGLASEAGKDLAGIVCGAGFEDRPCLLDEIASRWPLIGNSPQAVRAVNDPVTFFSRADQLGIPFPTFQTAKPKDLEDWLFKKTGGAGGEHIVSAELGHDGVGYFQKRVGGAAVSALVIGNGSESAVLGFSEQWSAPSTLAPMRWGGAVRPARVDKNVEARLKNAATLIVSDFELRGLNSVDFLVHEKDIYLLEVNARPGATVDIFDVAKTFLFGMHVSACRGDLPEHALFYTDAAATAVLYTERDIVVPVDFVWPTWCGDLPQPGEFIAKDSPVSTVFVEGETPCAAKTQIFQCFQVLQDALGTF